MQHDTNSPAGGDTGMHLREITLQDGRYMIFYTFDDSPPGSPSAETPGNRAGDLGREEPRPRPESEEERNV